MTLCKHLRFCAYKIWYVQQFLRENYILSQKSACLMLQKMDKDDDYLKHFFFSDEATFHVSGYVNKHIWHVWVLKSQFYYRRGMTECQIECLVCQSTLTRWLAFLLCRRHHHQYPLLQYVEIICSPTDKRSRYMGNITTRLSTMVLVLHSPESFSMKPPLEERLE
jgi:hypothetical protein